LANLGTVSSPPASGLRRPLFWVLTALGIALLNLPALLRPDPPADACGQAVPIVGPLVRFQNCDAHVFNLIAMDWSRLFSVEGETRLGRPAYLAAGWLMDRLLYVVTFGNVDPSSAAPPTYTAAETGYILLNIVLLTLAVLLAWRFALRGSGRDAGEATTVTVWRTAWGPLILLGVLVAVNPVTKAFLWTAHTQMFTILVPAIALLATSWAVSRTPSSTRVFVGGVLIGVGILAYAAMAVVTIAVAVGFLTRRLWTRALAIVIGTITLPILWVVTVTLVRGSYYSVETEKFRQFVWIGDALAENALASSIRGNIDALLRTFNDGQTILALLIIATIAVSFGFVLRMTGAPPDVSTQPRALAFIITLAAQSAFLFLMGFYQTRLTWGVIITLAIGVCAVAVAAVSVASGRLRGVINIACVAIAIGWYAIWVAIPLPWS